MERANGEWEGYATFHELVKGKHDPTPATLCKIADYYGVSTDYLLGRSDK